MAGPSIAHLTPSVQRQIMAPLGANALSALQGLSRGGLKPRLTTEQAAPLIHAGFARHVAHEHYMLTQLGEARAIMEKFL